MNFFTHYASRLFIKFIEIVVVKTTHWLWLLRLSGHLLLSLLTLDYLDL